MSVADVQEAITQAHHEEWARVVASLTRRFGDLDIAEEAAAEAFARNVLPVIREIQNSGVGSLRAIASALVELGAAMMVASTMVPPANFKPRDARSWFTRSNSIRPSSCRSKR